MKFELEGGRELAAALEKMKKVTAKAVARRALTKAAEPILDAWLGRITVLTGAYRRSATVGTKLNARQTAIARGDGPSEVEVYVGTNDPAGVQEEFGNAHQGADPSLRPAWEAEGGQKALDRIGEDLGTEIMRTVARAARRAARGR